MKHLLIILGLPCVTLMACQPDYDVSQSSISVLCSFYLNSTGQWHTNSIEELKLRNIDPDKCFSLDKD